MDIMSYILGLINGKKNGKSGVDVTIDGDEYSYSDPNHNGEITITEVDN